MGVLPDHNRLAQSLDYPTVYHTLPYRIPLESGMVEDIDSISEIL